MSSSELCGKIYLLEKNSTLQEQVSNAIKSVDSKKDEAIESINSARDSALKNIGSGLDETLSVSGKGADAKAAGDKIEELKDDLGSIDIINPDSGNKYRGVIKVVGGKPILEYDEIITE